MAHSFEVSRTQLIYALCLPLAVLMGYFLAEPLDSGALILVTCVLGLLGVPIMMRWHHPLLIFSWNAALYPAFLPGRPQLWSVMAFASLFFAVLARSTSKDKQFIAVPSIKRPLLFLAAVILVTMWLTGGVGIRSFGSSRFGGRNYFYLLMAICGYFALTSERIPAHRGATYVALFFLSSGFTALISHLAYFGGSTLSFLYWIFPADFAIEQARMESTFDVSMLRLTGLPIMATAIFCFILSRTGLRGLFDVSKPWRLLLVGAATLMSMLSGYRSAIVFLLLLVAALYWLEGLWRTRWFVSLGAVFCGGILLVSFADKLPLSAQRSIAFLPVRIDAAARQDATASTEWRLNMWKDLLPELPKYVLKGKGYGMDPNDMFMAQYNALSGFDSGASGSAMAGDYHNGPLTVYIPFGLVGVIAFGWLLVGGVRLLWSNYKYGEEKLLLINRFLLAFFLAKGLFFILIFGSFHLDLMTLTGILGLSVSLNHGQRKAIANEEVEEFEEDLELADPGLARH